MQSIVIPMLFLLIGCAKSGVPDETDSNAKPDPDAGKMVNEFAFDLFAELRKTETGKNIFISPYSISTALGMTATGARGNTLDQMRKVLHLPDDTKADANYASLAAVLKGGKGYELSTANAVWAQGGKYPWEEPFKKRLALYGVDAFHEVDFARDPNGARKQVNEWAEKQTKDRIKELLAKDAITEDTRMVLANAIYFKGSWATTFNRDWTKEAPFTNADGTTTTVPFMYSITLQAEHAQADDLDVFTVSYAGKELQIVFVLPKMGNKLSSIEDKLNAINFDRWIKNLRALDISIANPAKIPKLKLDMKYELKRTLTNLGMPTAFGSSDFSGMTKVDSLTISNVFHKSFLELNEEGTEAAAATAVAAMAIGYVKKPEFILNRPFLFAIRHRGTGAILFLGRVEKL